MSKQWTSKMSRMTSKMMVATMPNFEQMLKSAVDMMRNELKESLSQVSQELKESLSQSYAEILDQRCTKMEIQLKDISSDTPDLRRQLNALENKQNRFCLVVHGLPEKTQTSQPSGQARYHDDVADFIDLVNQRLELEFAHHDITDAYRLPTKEKTMRFAR